MLKALKSLELKISVNDLPEKLNSLKKLRTPFSNFKILTSNKKGDILQ